LKINAPGIYDLTMDQYHGDICDGPSVSASGLWKLINECPALFWETSALNPQRVTHDATRALDVGKAAHALVLGEPEFARHFAVLPFDNLRTKEAQAWKATTEEAGKTVVRADDFETVKAMAAAQKRSPQVSRAFRNGKPEKSLICKVGTGPSVWLKSRPDWLPDDPANGWIIDYKTCRTLEPRKFSAAAFEYGYHLQAALQVDVTQAVLGVDPMGVAHVVQEKESPYLAELRMFSPEQIELGRQEYRKALLLFSECWRKWKEGRPDREAWPGYTTEPQYFETPFHIIKRMDEYGNQDAGSGDTARYAATA
jgi:hypothetical protein